MLPLSAWPSSFFLLSVSEGLSRHTLTIRWFGSYGLQAHRSPLAIGQADPEAIALQPFGHHKDYKPSTWSLLLAWHDERHQTVGLRVSRVYPCPTISVF